MIASTTDCIAEVDGFSHPLGVDQIDLCHVISMLVPSECPKEGVRGPAAVDHERIDRFSNLLKHISHTAISVRDSGAIVNPQESNAGSKWPEARSCRFVPFE